MIPITWTSEMAFDSIMWLIVVCGEPGNADAGEYVHNTYSYIIMRIYVVFFLYEDVLLFVSHILFNIACVSLPNPYQPEQL